MVSADRLMKILSEFRRLAKDWESKLMLGWLASTTSTTISLVSGMTMGLFDKV